MLGKTRAPTLLCALLLVSTACGRERELREWTPDDHQPPPGGGSSDTRAAPEADPDPEATLFRSRCASCHGESGRGDGPAAPPNVPDLTLASFHAERTDEAIFRVIAEGRGLMPAFGDELTEAGISAMVRYVRRFGGASAIEPARAPADDGVPAGDPVPGAALP